MGGGNFLKTITLSLAGADTRATSAADEFSIDEATVFVYRTGPSGEVLYKTVQTTSSTVGVDLLFTDVVDFTYRFEAYANMGKLIEAPSEVSFEDESRDGFQMHGTLEGIDASSASSATVMLDRYVGRVVVSSVKLDWKSSANASEDFTLKRMWLANAAGVSGGSAVYNVGGAYSASGMDALLLSEVNQVIANRSTYSVPHYLYGYASGSTALVLECEWAGQTMYYHVDYEPVANSSMSYALSIHQPGSLEPLGEVTDDALTRSGTLQANVWDAQDSETAFGAPPARGAFVYHIDGSFYTASEWIAAESAGTVNDSEAVGVAVTDGEHSFVIHPTESTEELMWSSNTSVEVPGVVTPTTYLTVRTDFSGESNTAAILAAVEAGTIADAPAAAYCDGLTFAHSRKGYLPSAGEINLCYSYFQSVNDCMSAIGGTMFELESQTYWTSTQYSASNSWNWNDYNNGSLINLSKDRDYVVRAVSVL